MKVLFFLFLLSCGSPNTRVNAEKPINYIRTSTEFVTALQNNEDVTNYLKVFENANLDQLHFQLADDKQKITFWVNIYNGYILLILRQNESLYNDRRKFFKTKQINIGKTMWSFANIEHGILRRSQHEYFLGYMKRWFPSSLEKKMRVKKRDYRIHFALNCGAKSCPPVVAYEIDMFDLQLAESTKAYLKKNTTYYKEENEVHTTTLFSWFRGDFGGKKGIKKILFQQGLIPSVKVELEYNDYDWTLDLNNFKKI
ncbi:MAG: DUF547 domain-containing protein [Saprospiraceae bacterium]|nr:DUF547 domain-containing protein [Saprospiraceae bacterium]